jgi:hypothetical protein
MGEKIPFGSDAALMAEAADEITRLRSLTGWRTIETAEYKPNEMLALISLDEYGCLRWSCIGSLGTDGVWRAWLSGGIQRPTHWLPLPPAPSKEG